MKLNRTTAYVAAVISLILLLCGCNQTDDNAVSSGNGEMSGEEWEIAEIIYLDADYDQKSRSTYLYNDHGDMCRYESYDENDVRVNLFLWEYTYLEDGRVSSVYNDGGDATSSYNDVYTWDPSGRIAYIDRTWDDGSTGGPEMKAYDEQGRLIESADGTYQFYYTYTDTMNTVNRYWIKDDSCEYTVRKLNKNGSVEEMRVYNVDGFREYTEADLSQYTVYEYDKDGKLAGTVKYDASGNVVSASRNEYEDDSHSYTSTNYNSSEEITGYSVYKYRPLSEITE
ncbi:MAG: hypothetical protein E7218_04255 [Anaerofustis stercorihominis]|nr:hypothetical protein [Anaerofustis stercorihominis]